MSPHLTPHAFKIVLMHPQIAPNTGNIGRLCVTTNTELHLVRPLGFDLSEKNLKRSGMDYWPRLKLTLHDDEDAFFKFLGNQRLWLFTTKSTTNLWNADFQNGDYLLFGSETHGLNDRLLTRYANQTVRIPQVEAERCLNLSTAAGIGLYEALRRVS